MMDLLTRDTTRRLRHGGRRLLHPFEEQASVDAADVALGVAAGIVGGLVGSWVMNQVHGLTRKTIQSVSGSSDGDKQHADGQPENAQRQETEPEPHDDPATVKTATAVSKRVFHHKLTSHQKQVAGPAVHFGYGALMGGVYGGLAEVVPQVTTCGGTAYATALWLGGDEIAVPLLDLGPPPTESPPSAHADALAAHLVYGLTLEGVRRLIRLWF